MKTTSTILDGKGEKVRFLPFPTGNYNGLKFYVPVEEDEEWKLDIREDIYKIDFLNFAHCNFICTETTGEHFVISVLLEPIKPNTHRALQTTKKQYFEHFLVVPEGEEEFTTKIEKCIKDTIPNCQNVYPVMDDKFPMDFVTLEESHSQKRTTMKLGVIYSKNGQKSPLQMFENGLEKSFLNFINLMGHKITLKGWTKYKGDMNVKGDHNITETYYTEWNNVEVIYHIAPLLDKEGHRRLIGNDIAVMFFLDEQQEMFYPTEVEQLGKVPQIFCVVQPVGNQYKVCFFSLPNIKDFAPNIPRRLFSATEMKDLVLTKLFNGLVMTNYCPPMNRLFYMPRSSDLDSLCERYPEDRRKAALLNKTKKGKSSVGQNMFGLDKKPKISGKKPRAAELSITQRIEENNADSSVYPHHPIVEGLNAHLRNALETILEIYLQDSTKRVSILTEILQNSIEEEPMKVSEQIEKLNEVSQYCNEQIESINRVQKPIALLQSRIRGWIVHRNLEKISPLTDSWRDLINTEKCYLSQLESISKCYKLPLLKRIQSGQFTELDPDQINNLFCNVGGIVKITTKLLSRLETLHNYFPIVFNIGAVFMSFLGKIESEYEVYLLELQNLLNAWDSIMSSSLVRLFLIPAQKLSTFPDMPLSTLFQLPVTQLDKYYESLICIACELANIKLVSQSVFQSQSNKSFASAKQVIQEEAPRLKEKEEIPASPWKVSKSRSLKQGKKKVVIPSLKATKVNKRSTSPKSPRDKPSELEESNKSGSSRAHRKTSGTSGTSPKNTVSSVHVTTNPTPAASSALPPASNSFFTIHFPPNHKKTISPNNLQQFTKEIGKEVAKICFGRTWNIDDFFVQTADRIEVPLTTNFDEIAGNEAFLLPRDGSYSTITLLLHELNIKKTVLYETETETLASLVSKVGPALNFNPDEYWISGKSGKLPPDMLIRKIESSKVRLIKKDGNLIEDLMKSISKGDVIVTTQLLKTGIDVNQLVDFDKKALAPLHLACSSGNLPIVKLLIKHNASLDFRTSVQWTALHHAAYTENLDVLQYLLKCGSADNQFNPNAVNIDGNTCLHYLVRHKFSEKLQKTMDMFIKMGGNVNHKSNSGAVTPLYEAALQGNIAVCKYLLERGADPNIKAGSGYSTIELARSKGMNMDIFENVEHIGTNNLSTETLDTPLNQLQKAAETNQIPVIANILRTHFPNDEKLAISAVVNTACLHGHLNLIKYLAKNTTMETTLPFATFANPPICIAAKAGHLNIVDYFVKHSLFDPKSYSSDDGYTTLHYLATMKFSDKWQRVLENLLRAGADINCRSYGGDSPIHVAVGMGLSASNEVIECLILNGASLSVKNKQGLTAFQMAKSMGLKNLVVLLELISANPSLTSFGTDLFKRKTHINVPQDSQSQFDNIKTRPPAVINEIKEMWTAAKSIKQLSREIRAKMQGQYVLAHLGETHSLKVDNVKLVREGEIQVKKKGQEEFKLIHAFIFEQFLLFKKDEQHQSSVPKRDIKKGRERDGRKVKSDQRKNHTEVSMYFFKYMEIEEIPPQTASDRRLSRIICNDATDKKTEFEVITDEKFLSLIYRNIPKVIGIPLHRVVELPTTKHNIPLLVRECTDYLRVNGIVENIFFVSGETKKVNQLKETYNQNKSAVELNRDPHSVSTVLKSFFWDLPEPLLPNYPKLLEIYNGTATSILQQFKQFMEQLPSENYYLLQHLFHFLNSFLGHNHITKIEDQLGSIISPNIMKLESDTAFDKQRIKTLGNISQFLIQKAKEIFDRPIYVEDQWEWLEEFKRENSSAKHPPPNQVIPKKNWEEELPPVKDDEPPISTSPLLSSLNLEGEVKAASPRPSISSWASQSNLVVRRQTLIDAELDKGPKRSKTLSQTIKMIKVDIPTQISELLKTAIQLINVIRERLMELQGILSKEVSRETLLNSVKVYIAFKKKFPELQSATYSVASPAYVAPPVLEDKQSNLRIKTHMEISAHIPLLDDILQNMPTDEQALIQVAEIAQSVASLFDQS